MDESTDVAGLPILLVFVRYENMNSFEEDLLFCRPQKKEKSLGTADIAYIYIYVYYISFLIYLRNEYSLQRKTDKFAIEQYNYHIVFFIYSN